MNRQLIFRLTCTSVAGRADWQRRVALALLVAVFLVFGSAAPAEVPAAQSGHTPSATATMLDLAATTPPAPSVAHEHSTPELPLAAKSTGDPAVDIAPPASTGERSPVTTGEQPRAH